MTAKVREDVGLIFQGSIVTSPKDIVEADTILDLIHTGSQDLLSRTHQPLLRDRGGAKDTSVSRVYDDVPVLYATVNCEHVTFLQLIVIGYAMNDLIIYRDTTVGWKTVIAQEGWSVPGVLDKAADVAVYLIEGCAGSGELKASFDGLVIDLAESEVIDLHYIQL